MLFVPQWGSVSITHGVGNYTINFPIKFNSLFALTDSGIFDVRILSRSVSGFKIEQRNGEQGDIFSWTAIGK